MTMQRPAVFLDRDGTLNEDVGYLTSPAQMRLLPGVGPALQQLRAAGFACVVVTNQSAVGRGMITDAELNLIHEEMTRRLAAVGAAVDGIYAATAMTDHPDRKPAPGLLVRAAADLHLDLANSWMIGDTVRDILAGQRAGCKGFVLVRTGHPLDEMQLQALGPTHIADDLLAAAAFILARVGSAGELTIDN